MTKNGQPIEGDATGQPASGVAPPQAAGEERAKILPPSLVQALEGAGVDPRDPSVTKAVAVSLSIMTASASLPLPPPSVMMDYEKALPGLNAKLVEWTEKQASHRQSMEMKASTGSETRMGRSQLFTGLIAVVSLFLAAYEGQFGNPYVASVIAIVGVGGPAAAIYLARTGRINPSAPSQSPKLPPKPTSPQAPSGKSKRRR